MLNISVVSRYDNYDLILKIRKIWRLTALEIGRVRRPTVNWCLLAREPVSLSNIRTNGKT